MVGHRGLWGNRLASLSVSLVNWHFCLVCLPLLPHFCPLGPEGSPSAFSLSLIFHSPWLQPSKISQAHMEAYTPHRDGARLLGQLFVSTALSCISTHCSKKSSPRSSKETDVLQYTNYNSILSSVIIHLLQTICFFHFNAVLFSVLALVLLTTLFCYQEDGFEWWYLSLNCKFLQILIPYIHCVM